MDIVNIMIFDAGTRRTIPVKIETLNPELQELFKPFAGKTVTWDGGKPKEMEKQ